MLADMLQGRGTSGSTAGDVRRSVLGVATPPDSKVLSLEELEGNIKGAAATMISQQQQQQKHTMQHPAQHQHVATPQQQQQPPQPQKNNHQQQEQNKGGEDVDAFKQMMEQAGGHGLSNGPATNSSSQQNASNANNNAAISSVKHPLPPTLMELLAQSQSATNSQSDLSQQHFPTITAIAPSHYATKQQQQIEFHMKQQQQ